MPGYKSHLAGGIGAFIVLLVVLLILGFRYLNLELVLMLFGVSLLGALLPDVDTDSKSQSLFYGILVIIDLVLLVLHHYRAASILGFIALFPALGHHRGWTHTLWAMLLIPSPILILPIIIPFFSWSTMLMFYLAATIGYLSHLLLDKTL